MATVSKGGQTEPSISVSGERTGHTEKVSSFMLTETYMMDSGQMIKLMDTVLTNM